MANGPEKKNIAQEASISRDAFVRAWSKGTFEEQGEMLFDLLGESVFIRVHSTEQKQQELEGRICSLENDTDRLRKELNADFHRVERKLAYFAGGLGVIAVLAGPIAVAIAGLFV